VLSITKSYTTYTTTILLGNAPSATAVTWSSTQSSGSLNPATIGVIVGSVIGGILVSIALYYCYLWLKRRPPSRKSSPRLTPSPIPVSVRGGGNEEEMGLGVVEEGIEGAEGGDGGDGGGEGGGGAEGGGEGDRPSQASDGGIAHARGRRRKRKRRRGRQARALAGLLGLSFRPPHVKRHVRRRKQGG
jgi:hypothetical protein